MKLLGKTTLHDFKARHADAKPSIESWENEVEEAQWDTPHQLKLRYPKASFVGGLQVVFNFCWNKYRLLTTVNYKNKIILVDKIGTHKEYDKWNLN
jgi:mRNA interferase HigB